MADDESSTQPVKEEAKEEDTTAERLIPPEKPHRRPRRRKTVVAVEEKEKEIPVRPSFRLLLAAAAAVVRVTDPLLCRLRHWEQHTATALGLARLLPLSVWTETPPTTGPDAFDAWLLDRLEHGLFRVSRAMLRLQNRECVTAVRLWHIVQSRDWTIHLARLAANHDDPVAVEWFRRHPTHIRFDAPKSPVDVQQQRPTASAAAPVPRFLRLVRDAMARPDLEEDELDRRVEQTALRGGTRKRLTARWHAQVQLAHLLAHPRDWPARAWLTNFLAMGCACAS